MAEKIDGHHHLWRYSAAEYGWIDESMAVLKRNFLSTDLVAVMKGAGVDGAVAVQARQTLEETQWLLELADECDGIRGVVGWAPIAEKSLPRALEEFAGQPKLKGLRHIIQAERDESYILRDDFNSGIRTLEGSGLIYDILIYERHLPQTIEFVDRHPNQPFVLDHVAKPRIRQGVMEPWASRVRDLARRQNVWCKVSGMVTEADWRQWSAEDFKPYLDVVFETFGVDRLMFGSDWPVCLLAASYGDVVRIVSDYTRNLPAIDTAKIFGLNAARVYQHRNSRHAIAT